MNLFYFDELSLLITGLVVFIALNVGRFSLIYMQGERNYVSFLIRLFLVSFSIVLMISSNHILLFFISWMSANFFMVKLIVHKKEWVEARNSGKISNLSLWSSMVLMGLALILFYLESHSFYIQNIIQMDSLSTYSLIGLGLLSISALVQSANWPFHKWLLSSLNAPTPVSALMHAGLINGGALIITRFSPLFVQGKSSLAVIFIFGTITAILGSFWKLIQTDVKKTLACSTMAQMGFMLMQCGLGLFPAAITHIIWHGLFKAYLFLASGNAAKEKKSFRPQSFTVSALLMGIVFSAAGVVSFSLTSKSPFLPMDTSLFITALVFITGIQSVLALLENRKTIGSILAAGIMPSLIGFLYGYNMYFVEQFLSTFNIAAAQDLELFHVIALGLFLLLWVTSFILFRETSIIRRSKFFKKLYVKSLNSSQSHASTITAHHNNYHF